MEGFSKIGVDWWGVLLYLINYGVLLAVLAKLVYPRLINVIDERRSLIASNLSDADKLRNELMAQTALAEKERKELLNRLEQESIIAKKELQEKRKELMEEMNGEREKMLADARALIQEEKEKLIADVEQKLMQVVQAAVLHIAMTKVSDEEVKASIEHTWHEVEKV